MSAALGAVVEGVDLRNPIPELGETLLALLDEHLVIVVRDQHLSESEHVALTWQLGRPWIFPVNRMKGMTHFEPVTVAATCDEPLFTDKWHGDFSYLPAPPGIGILCAVDMPPYGGDTMFLNMQLGFERLPGATRDWLTDVQVHQSIPQRFLDRKEHDDPIERALVYRICTGNVHPAVRKHPRTGRAALYVHDPAADLVGIETEVARPVMEDVVARATHLNHTCRWRWRNGDVVLYDQTATLHRLIIDPWPGVRSMRRTLIEGDPPVGM